MYAGKIVETSTSAELFAEPLHPYTRGLLAAIPSMAHERGRLAAIEGTVPELIDPSPSCSFHTRCPYATELCSGTEPPLREYEPFHQAACFIYEDPEEWSGAALPTFERTRQ
jgi:oligopeptide/dipeptide ABC transporter ATP-binding protein